MLAPTLDSHIDKPISFDFLFKIELIRLLSLITFER